MGLELRQAFTELRLEPREVELIQLAQISLVRRVDRIEPVHKAECECGMRNCNAEVGPGMRPVEPMPAPQFRIPHSALRFKSGDVEREDEGNYPSSANRLATSSVRGATDGSGCHWSVAWCVEGAAPPGSQRSMHWSSGSTIQYSHPCAR